MKIRIILLGICLIIAWHSIQQWGLTPSFISTKGNDYYNNGDFDKAITDYTKTISMDPKYTEAYYNRGQAYYKKKNMRRQLRITPRVLNCSLMILRYTTAAALPTSTEGNTTMPLRTQPRQSPEARILPLPITTAGLPTPRKGAMMKRLKTITRLSL